MPVRTHWRKPLFIAMSLLVGLGAALAVAVHEVPQAGPLVANSLRGVIGVNGVAQLEEMTAAVEDRAMSLRWHGEAARSLSELSEQIVSATPRSEPAHGLGGGAAVKQLFAPADIRPPYAQVAAPGDGVWLPVRDPEHPQAPVLMYETLIHPDPERRWAELFVVAMPAKAVRVVSVPGTAEPSSDNPAAKSLPHRGLIPLEDQSQLLAAFNGGFRAEHGHHGMFVDGVTLLPPRPEMCTVAGYGDGTLRIGSYEHIEEQKPQPSWFRQTARCMVEGGQLHAGLRDPDAHGWGSTIDGKTVIRRSAIALSEDGALLYVAVSNYTSARALAVGMQAAGGYDVAQLDVNFSFPKFLLFPRDGAGVRHAASLFKGFLFEPNEMIDQADPRDFFYVVRRPADARA